MIFFSFFTKEAKEMIYLYYNSRKKGKKKEFVIEMARKVSPVFGQYYRRSKPRTCAITCPLLVPLLHS